MTAANNKTEIINCHTHVFTNDSVPNQLFLWPLPLVPFLRLEFIGKPLSWFLRKVLRSKYDRLERVAAVAEMSSLKSQLRIFENLTGYYPKGTRFVLLSMDLKYMGKGKVPQEFEEQLEGLRKIKEEYSDLVFPFICADPRRPWIEEFVKDYLENGGFHGIKIYPPLGYLPFDERLQGIYQYAEEKQIPILAHCTPDGLKGRRYKDDSSIFADPDNYKEVLEEHHDLKICLAHFGGITEWRKYLKLPWTEKKSSNQPEQGEKPEPGTGWNPRTGETQEKAWVSKIADMIKSGKYPNLYTDISYTAHDPQMHAFLKVLLEDKKLRERILFGSDYYVVQFETSERDFSIGLRGYLGEEKFDQIARKNPRRYLGLENT